MGSKKKQRIRARRQAAVAATPPPETTPAHASPPAQWERFLTRRHRWLEWLGIALILVIALLFRLEDLGAWHEAEQRAFHDGEPIHTTFDAWFYLSLARDLTEGEYQPVDAKRAVPEGRPRPNPPPLISTLAAGLTQITPYSLSWVGAILPPVLGMLLAIPVYALGRYYGGPVAGLTAGLLAVLYPIYLYRSNVGWFDTDPMNVTWAVAAAYLFLRFARTQGPRRYTYFGGGLLVYGLFLWWWDQAPEAVTAITLLPLAVALVFFYRPGRREGMIFYGGLGAAGLGAAAYLGPTGVLDVGRGLWQKFDYIVHSPSADGPFPSIGVSISEQNNLELETLLNATTQEPLPLVLAALGLAALFIRRPRDSLFLASLVVLAAGSYFANRFLIFFVPLLALGTGYALALLWQAGKRFRPWHAVVPAVALPFLLWPLYQNNEEQVLWPKQTAPRVAAMKLAGAETPEDAVIWAWWDHGYALHYYARRGTISDGSAHGGERTVYNGIPLVADTHREAANFMRFFVRHGVPGLREVYTALGGDPAEGLRWVKQILAEGPEAARTRIAEAGLEPVGGRTTPEDWLTFFFPETTRPVYLFLDSRLISTSYWWHWFGTWDIEDGTGHHATYRAYFNIRRDEAGQLYADGLRVDPETGYAELGGRRLALSEILIRTNEGIDRKRFTRRGPRFEMLQGGRFGVLMDSRIADSVFNRLFLRHTGSKHGYFQPVALEAPNFQLWEVGGDRWPPEGSGG